MLKFGDVIYRPCLSHSGKKNFVNTQIVREVVTKPEGTFIFSYDVFRHGWADREEDLGVKIFTDRDEAHKALLAMITDGETGVDDDIEITKSMVIDGYNKGLIKLVKSPNDDGISCEIGDFWFYFGGYTAEIYDSVEEYREAVTVAEIIKEIYEVLVAFKKDFPDEYLYYYHYLITNL